MSEPRRRLAAQELEDGLAELAVHVELPVAHQLGDRVRTALLAQSMAEPAASRRAWQRTHDGRYGRWRAHFGRRALGVVAVCLALVALVLVLSPAARASFTDLFHIPGVEILRVTSSWPVQPPVGTKLDLGVRVTLASAQKRLQFRILVPSFQRLGHPDDVYVDGPLSGQVSLVYRARPGFPAAAKTGVGLLITEFHAGLEPAILKKLAFMGTTVENVRVSGSPGVWLSGSPHFFGYATGNGEVIIEQLRLAGNTLLWVRGGLTYRLEAQVTRDVALQIAASMR
jgi:hypothetical protein